MAVDYSTTALLAAIKRKLQIPSGDTKLTDTELLNIADDEMRSFVIPKLLTVREDYFVEQGTIAGSTASRVLLPAPIQAETILSVACVLSSGVTYPVSRVNVQTSDIYATSQNSTPTSYALQGDYLYMLPVPNTETWSLLIRFERMPGRLVAISSTQQAIPASLNTSTFTLDPTTTATFATTEYVTAFRNAPPFPSGFGYAPVTSSNSTTLVLGTPLWGTLGSVLNKAASSQPYYDYISRWNESPIVPLPEAWHPVMLYAACCAVAREYGDTGLADQLEMERNERVELMIKSASNRVRNQPLKAFDRNSPLRRGLRTGSRGTYGF